MKRIICLLALCLGTWLQAVEINTGFNFSNSYRHDQLERKNSLHSENATFFTDTVNVKNIPIWQIGLNGYLAPPQDHFYWSDNPILSPFSNIYVDGFAYWGWGGWKSTLTEQIENLLTDSTLTGKAKLRNVHTWDIQIGLGYLFDWQDWGLGLSAGYAYDTQDLHASSGKISSVRSPIYSHYHTRTIWKGPWVGIEVFYDWCPWTFSLGYEYHRALYTSNHFIDDSLTPNAQGFEDSTHSKHAQGNVAFLEANLHIYEQWEAALSFKYQNWQARKGRLKPDDVTFSQLDFPANTTGSATGSWISYAVTLDLGYSW